MEMQMINEYRKSKYVKLYLSASKLWRGHDGVAILLFLVKYASRVQFSDAGSSPPTLPKDMGVGFVISATDGTAENIAQYLWDTLLAS